MIHYHGTPITPNKYIQEMRGKHFCVSYARPDQLKICLKIGQSLMFDNGAFSAFTSGKVLNFEKYKTWVEKYVYHPHWCVIPDVIDGTVEQQRELLKNWHFPKSLSAPVFHLHLSFDWLWELVNEYDKVCLGSSGKFWKIKSPLWRKRMDDLFNFLEKKTKRLPWLHGMRMLSLCDDIYPIASADSTNIARNFKDIGVHPLLMANRLDVKQTPAKFIKNQKELFHGRV